MTFKESLNNKIIEKGKKRLQKMSNKEIEKMIEVLKLVLEERKKNERL